MRNETTLLKRSTITQTPTLAPYHSDARVDAAVLLRTRSSSMRADAEPDDALAI